MTSTTKHKELIGKLLVKTIHDDISWQATKEYLQLPLSELVVRIGKRGSNAAPDTYFLELRNQDDVLLDTIEADDQLGELYNSATERVSRSAIDQALQELDEDPPRFVPPKIILPSRPTNEDESRLFAGLQGVWLVDFIFGKEIASISPTGAYSAGKTRDTLFPKFLLRLLAQNPDTNKFEIAKDNLDGRRKQIEVLQLDAWPRPMKLVGEAQHDRHKLVYSRLE